MADRSDKVNEWFLRHEKEMLERARIERERRLMELPKKIGRRGVGAVAQGTLAKMPEMWSRHGGNTARRYRDRPMYLL